VISQMSEKRQLDDDEIYLSLSLVDRWRHEMPRSLFRDESIICRMIAEFCGCADQYGTSYLLLHWKPGT